MKKTSHENDFSSENNLDKNYDEYYRGGKNSKYNQNRFKSSDVAISEENTLTDLITEALRNNSPKIRFFEFGCGDGRFLPAIEKIAEKLAMRNVELEVIAYDITRVGLKEYENRIREKFGNLEHFEECVQMEENFEEKENPQEISIIGVYKFNNTSIKLVKGNVNTQPQEISEFLNGTVDITSAMFGPLAHIRPQSLRIDFLKMFKDITTGKVAITVPSDGQFKKHQEAYNMMRDHGILDGEAGDINYKVPDTNIINQYHVFSEDELRESFEKAGYNSEKTRVFISTVYDTATITKNSFNNYFDFLFSELLSNILPAKKMSQYSSYLGVIAEVEENPKLPSTSIEISETTALINQNEKQRDI